MNGSPTSTATSSDLSEELIAAYVAGTLSPHRRVEVEAALDRNPRWLAVVAATARAQGRCSSSPIIVEGDEADASPSEQIPFDPEQLERLEQEQAARLAPGTRLERYELLHLIGRGAMGLVYAAYDPELDRRVALKVLRRVDTGGQARLLREARALARVSDPHVITVYDVGSYRGRVFVATELLDGQTLQEWIAAAPRPWREVVRCFVEAGKGLAVAHAAGLVHRDFKPSNVMLTRDGRVIVLDFGLARIDGQSLDPSPQPRALLPGEPSPSQSLTQAGHAVGTPKYMAPEQRDGLECGPQADQYAFCVALHEALYGSVPALGDGSEGGHRTGPAARGAVPLRLRRAFVRGLAQVPEHRYESMLELVAALQDILRPRGRRAALGVVLIAVAAATWGIANRRQSFCRDGEAMIADVWNDSRAAAVRDRIAGAEMSWNQAVGQRVSDRLATYAGGWVDRYTAACEATRIEGAQSEAVLDLRMQCLDRRRQALAATVDVLSTADQEAALRALQAVDAMPAIGDCDDVLALQRPQTLPESGPAREQAQSIFADLARAEALRQTARLAEADTLITQALARAEALKHAPTEADARLLKGWILTDQGQHAQAEAQLRAGLHAAERGQHLEAIAMGWNRLAWVVGYKLARHEEGRELAEHARGWLQGRPGGARYQEISRLRTLGWIELEAGATEGARAHFQDAVRAGESLEVSDPVRAQEIALSRNGEGAAALAAGDLPAAQLCFTEAAGQLASDLGDQHPDVVRVRNNIAALLRARGSIQESLALFGANLRAFEASLGEQHSAVGQTLLNIAVAELDLGRRQDAQVHAGRAIEVLIRAEGPDHPLVAKARTLRADAWITLEHPEEAIAELQVALASERRSLGRDHPSVGIIESNLGVAYHDLGEYAEAAQHLQRALQILETQHGADHPDLAVVLVSLGITRRAQSRLDDALALFRRAETVGQGAAQASALRWIGEVMLDRGQVRAAAQYLRQARSVYGQTDADPAAVGDTAFALARALAAMPPSADQEEEIRRLAEEAIGSYREADLADEAQAVLRWQGDGARG